MPWVRDVRGRFSTTGRGGRSGVLNIRVEGETALIQNLEALPRQLTAAAARRVARVGAQPLAQRMRELAPFAPGKPDLRDTIIVRDLPAGSTLILRTEVGVEIGPSLAGFYGFFQEFGTVHHGAQPFARPAFDQAWPLALALMRVDLWAAIELSVR